MIPPFVRVGSEREERVGRTPILVHLRAAGDRCGRLTCCVVGVVGVDGGQGPRRARSVSQLWVSPDRAIQAEPEDSQPVPSVLS